MRSMNKYQLLYLSIWQRYIREQEDLCLSSTFVWFDVVAVCQHYSGTLRPGELKQVFGPMVGSIGRVVCVFTAWDDPSYIKRMWCLFELVMAINFGCQWDIAMPFTQIQAFHEGLKYGSMMKFLSALSSVDVGNACAREENDRLAILCEMRTIEQLREYGSGISGVNNRVAWAMKEWMLGSARKAVGGDIRDISTLYEQVDRDSAWLLRGISTVFQHLVM